MIVRVLIPLECILKQQIGQNRIRGCVSTEKLTTPDNPTNPTNPSTPIASTEKPKETPTTPKTGDDRNPLIWLLLFGIGGCMAGAAWYLRKKDEKDQNQE